MHLPRQTNMDITLPLPREEEEFCLCSGHDLLVVDIFSVVFWLLLLFLENKRRCDCYVIFIFVSRK